MTNNIANRLLAARLDRKDRPPPVAGVRKGGPEQRWLGHATNPVGDRVETVLEVYAHVTSKMRAVAPSRLTAMIDAPRRTATLAYQM